MKRITLLIPGIFMWVLFCNFSNDPGTTCEKKSKLFPKKIQKIVDRSCAGCHNDEARSDKSKKALNFSAWNEYKIYKKIAKLEEIHETVVEGDMPPKKFLAKYPGKKLSEEEIKLLSAWAEKEAMKLEKKLEE